MYVETIKSSKYENVYKLGAYLTYWKIHSYILIDNGIYYNWLLNMNIIDKVSMNVDVQENEVMPLLL